MKKKLLVLGMVIACALGLAACDDNTAAVDEDTKAMAMEVSSSYIQTIQQVIDEGNVETVVSQSEELKPIFDNWQKGMEELGSIKSYDDVKVKPDGKKMIVNTAVTGTKLDPKEAPRTADIELIYDTKTYNLVSVSVNVKYTTPELMKKAGLNTLIGMGTVFCVLILIMIVIYCFNFISMIEKAIAKSKETESATDKAVDNTIAQIIENEELSDDTELIAVLSAAIAAYESETGSVSADGVVIRSIRKVNKSKWQNA